uniref:Glycoside hydrolase family 3 C-terminal domain-containing protein n=1 Tax=Phenylobacterium glaciei TaxID=2803784 RepID=A0A974P448_9CAUL|nr:hypothetical protein JKL49_06090 [Phenylobacterium glaciei]
MAGLDQESGEQLDKQVYFGAPLKEAVEQGGALRAPDRHGPPHPAQPVRQGVFDNPTARRETDYEANAKLAQTAAEAGTVLLKNDGVLPLAASIRKIAVIGAHADKG